MKYLYIAILLFGVSTGFNAHADEWLCTSQASQRAGTVIKSCGVGLGFDEAGARYQATKNSIQEFHQICGSSHDCEGHKVSAQPMRTSCQKDDGFIKCYRLVIFTIQTDLIESQVSADNDETDMDRFWKHWNKQYLNQ